ncbi:NUMOD3 domain-containing DNA-binding protein [Ensifer sesbaniae]|uniref:NUMOD3 domain-containing DNA-binding protein n=1 Tax=Ensifer sesbaniae TaxID=1214071 RepID=UPI002000F8C8|nr:NUMOD3 domain-containing DNA-binding protein [Ensifer sesbaniae]
MYSQFNKSRETMLYAHMIRKARRGNRKKGEGTYYERHHILPKCMGGSNAKSNLTLLTAEEHLRAHMLLADMVDEQPYKHKMVFALHAMMYGNSDQKRVGVIQFYAVAKRKYGEAMSEAMKGRKLTDEHRANLGAAKRGNTYMKGKTHTSETKAKMSAVKKGKKPTDETKAKLSAAKKGKTPTDETKAKLSAANRGKKRTDETKAKMSAARKGKKCKPLSVEHRMHISEANMGEKNYKFAGYYIVPFGRFATIDQAKDACNGLLSNSSISKFCRSSDKLISKASYTKSVYLQTLGPFVIGRTFADVGFSFDPA